MISQIDLSSTTVGYVFDEVMDIQSLNDFWYRILDKLAQEDQISLYLEDTNVQSFALNFMLIIALFPLKHAHRFKRIAFVSLGKPTKSAESLRRMLSQINIRSFPVENRNEAMAWVNQTEG